MALRYDSTLLQLRAAYGYSHTQYESDDNCCFLNQTEGQNNAPYLLSKINVRTYLWVCSFSQSSSFLNWQTLVPSHNEIVKRIQQSWLSVHVNFRDTLRYCMMTGKERNRTAFSSLFLWQHIRTYIHNGSLTIAAFLRFGSLAQCLSERQPQYFYYHQQQSSSKRA